MQTNRSMPPGTVIPELAYPDVATAAVWLRDAFGFSERLRIGNHRIQMTVGGGSIVVVESDDRASRKCRTMVKVESIDEHCRRAQENGAVILAYPETHVFGERQYSAQDPGGHTWTFSQPVADVDPSEWGGVLVSDLK